MKIARSNSDSMLKLKGKQLPAFNQLSPIMSPRTSREWLDLTEEFEINENPNEGKLLHDNDYSLNNVRDIVILGLQVLGSNAPFGETSPILGHL